VECHATEAVHLGILLVDVPLNILWPHAVRDLQIDLAISGLITVLITIGVYWLLHRLVVRRVEAFRRPLAEFGAGNFGVRLPVQPNTDEIGQLAQSFNRMATQLELHVQEERELSTLRQRAIVEERKRIARELHDGLAQVLGYINTKATAVRLLLKKRQIEAAEIQLQQFEVAARGLFVDVREAILGLRMTSQANLHLTQMLTEYATRFSQLSDLPVEVTLCPGAEKIGEMVENKRDGLANTQGYY
jgi:nitrate/nitrite-specific signal transduction histidine kinase